MKYLIITTWLILVTPLISFAEMDPFLLEAKMLAIDISNDLRAPEELTNRILNDLATIRSSYPICTT